MSQRLRVLIVTFRCCWPAVLVTLAFSSCRSAFAFDERSPPPPECRAPNWCIIGTVLADSSGGAVSGAQVVVSGTPCAALTDATGLFALVCSEVPGNTLVVQGLGYEVLRERVSVTPGRSYVARIRLRAVSPRIVPDPA